MAHGPTEIIAAPLDQAVGVGRRFIFSSEQMDLCAGEVSQAAGVIQVQMCQHDVPDILNGISQPDNLPRCCLFPVARGANQPQEDTHQG